MKRSVMLTITSLLSILLMTFHLSDDIVRGFEPGGVKNISGMLSYLVVERTSEIGIRLAFGCHSARIA